MERKQRNTKKAVAALAAQIRTARSRMQLSQGEFAAAIGGVSQQQVSDWESGKRLRVVSIAIRLLRLLEQAEAGETRDAAR